MQRVQWLGAPRAEPGESARPPRWGDIPPSQLNLYHVRAHGRRPWPAGGGRLRRKAGATMVEIVLAMLVLVIAGGGAYLSHLYSHQLSEHANDSLQAVNDLDDMLERIHATAFNNLQADFPDGVADGGGAYAAIVDGYTLPNEQITVTYPSATTVRLEMLVTVTWVTRGRARTASLSTVRTTS